MIKLVDVTYYTHLEYTKPGQVLERHHLVTRYAKLLQNKMQITLVKHAGFEGFCEDGGLVYHFFKGINKFRFLPLKANRFIAREHPGVVLVQGLGFPLQIMALRLQCGNSVKIVVQHHGELPFKGIKLWCQRLAARAIDAYLFTSAGNARVWRQKGVIKKRHQIFEVLEASTYFTRSDKWQSRKKLDINATGQVFLWVGRLNANKNPLMILKAFAQYLHLNPSANLYMIYQTDELLDDIKTMLATDGRLGSAVTLVGSVANDELPIWFSTADYYLSGSYKEGSGYALLEAMACGCIPVVTNIPSFQKITVNGKYGYLYKPGDYRDLHRILCALDDPSQISADDVVSHFNRNLSFEKIAADVYDVCLSLVTGH